RNHRYVLMNRAGEQLLGVARDQVIGKNAHEFFPKDVADSIVEHDQEIMRSGEQLIIENSPMPMPNGGMRLLTTKRLTIRDHSGQPQYLLAIIEDVTERRRSEERIAHLAHHDPLTDLPNRAAFTEHLTSTLERAQKTNQEFAVLCMDLDRFKVVNDVFGHVTGDALLEKVARRLQEIAAEVFL